MVTKSTRKTSGLPVWAESLEAAAVVTEWLNAAAKAKGSAGSYARVAGLMEDMREIETRWGWIAPNAPESERHEWSKLNRKFDEVKRMLSRYSFYLVPQWLLLSKRWQYRLTSLAAKHDFVLKTEHHGQKKARGTVVAGFYGYYNVGEADVVYGLLRLATASELGRIKQCETCGTWFYGRRSHQRFCSQACQLKHYSTTPNFKRYRKEYMRQFRSNRQKLRQRRY